MSDTAYGFSSLYESYFSFLPSQLLPSLTDKVLLEQDSDWSISPELYRVLTKTKIEWGEIGYLVYRRTYSRTLPTTFFDGEIKEEFPGTVLRVILACRNQLKVGFTEEEEVRLAKHLLQFKGMVAGRFLWQLGTETVQKLGLLSLQNCAFAPIDRTNSFIWGFEALLLGSGVGFSVEKKFISQLPQSFTNVEINRVFKDSEIDLSLERENSDLRLETSDGCRELIENKLDCKLDVDYVVADSREGWVGLLEEVFKAFFVTGKTFTYTVQAVRPKNVPIKGFGGVSSGPEPLCEGIEQIVSILKAGDGSLNQSKKLSSVDCLDIMATLASIVVSGNVRRSALLALGDPDDENYLKTKRWDLGPIPNCRCMCNNSVNVSDVEQLIPAFWETYLQGEPFGIVNIEGAKKQGRTGDTRYLDLDSCGVNPCSEQSLNAFETCALGETFISRCESEEEFKDVCSLLYRTIKHSLRLPCHLKQTEEIVHKNMRMGIGITGILQCTEEQLSWLSPTYEFLREFDVNYSKNKDWPVSIKLTTTKPSGSLSLLPGVCPGAHPSPSGPYYIRRVRVASNSPLIGLCEENGYSIEYVIGFDGTEDKTTKIVSFPCCVPENTPVASNFSAEQQLETVKRIQKDWSDNAVSVTVYYTKEEIPWIKGWLKENLKNDIKAVSFLLKSEHGFLQAPYEDITKEQYWEMKNKTTPITQGIFEDSDMDVVSECSGGSCGVR